MKKSILNLCAYSLLVTSITFTSCGDDDNNPLPEVPKTTLENLAEGVLQGELTQDFTLVPTTEYKVKGVFKVASGSKLTIPEGTKIVSEKGTDRYIAVLMGGSIDIQGTAAKPVVMTSVNAKAGEWGGLVICGKAKTTKGTDVTAEVGQLPYGGTDTEDNSGSIKYLVIRGAGAQINTDSQFNGLTLYAVGSKTVIENVSIIDGTDDGVEFFGGSAKITNLYVKDNEDDSIDWTEGWDGSVENAYISHTKSGFSTVVEADKENKNPKLINLTAISTIAGGEGIALQFKKQSGATITNLFLEGYKTNIDMVDNGPLTNVKIDGKDATTTDAYNTGTKVDISTWTWKDAE